MANRRFEVVSKYKDCGINLPIRKTECSAGYDFEAAEDIIIPACDKLFFNMQNFFYDNEGSDKQPVTMAQMKNMAKTSKARPTLVPTGIKCQLEPHTYLELSARSSLPLNHWLILANSVGIIDADYYNNPDNEGEIFFQLINFSPFDIKIQKGEAIGQGIIKNYLTTEDDCATGARVGGFGSTSAN